MPRRTSSCAAPRTTRAPEAAEAAQPIGDSRVSRDRGGCPRPKFDGGIVTRLDCLLWHRRQRSRPTLLRRRRRHVAQAIRDLGKADRSSARADRIFDRRCQERERLHAFGLSAGCYRVDPGVGRSTRLFLLALEATIDGFNCAVRPGTLDLGALDDCRTEGLNPDKTHWAQRLDAPPYWAYPLRPVSRSRISGSRWTNGRAC